MPRSATAKETARTAKAKRETALQRAEFAYPSVARTSADSPTSFAVKAEDPGIRAMIDAALARKERA